MVRLIPRETKFFDMFSEVADNLVAGAKVLSDCLHNYDYERLPSVVEKIKEIEHRGDSRLHQWGQRSLVDFQDHAAIAVRQSFGRHRAQANARIG
jgi:hypothetical protein